MTTTHLVLRYAHISMGMLALVSGAVAMIFAKGSPVHRRSGNVFFVSMLLMAATGTWISVFIRPIMGNVMGGMLAFYLTATAWATVWRRPGATGRVEIGLAALGLATATAGIVFGLQASSGPRGSLDGYPAPFYFVFGGAALLATAMDVRMIVRGGLAGAPRLSRHLVRMCAAMFMATASFFLGQAKLFSPAVRASGVLKVPVLLVIGVLLYWLVRVRVAPPIRRMWRARAVRLEARSTVT